MKLKPINREYPFRDGTITLETVPAVEVAKIANLTQKKDLRNVEKQVPIFTNLIYNYTSLGDDNTKEEIETLLSMEEVMELGIELLTSEDKEKNFMKSQSTGSPTTDSE